MSIIKSVIFTIVLSLSFGVAAGSQPQEVSSVLVAPGLVLVRTKHAAKTIDTRRIILIEDLAPRGDWWWNTRDESHASAENGHAKPSGPYEAWCEVVSGVAKITLSPDPSKGTGKASYEEVFFPATTEELSLAIARVTPK